MGLPRRGEEACGKLSRRALGARVDLVLRGKTSKKCVTVVATDAGSQHRTPHLPLPSAFPGAILCGGEGLRVPETGGL